MPRKSKGKQKIEMRKISKESNLRVTFSKRRSGVFKKASELCILFGVEIALIVFSPGNKAFSFGHPSVQSIIERFHTQIPPSTGNSSTLQLVDAHQNASVHELTNQVTDLENELEKQRKRSEELTQMMKERQVPCWWESSCEELGLQELEQLKGAMDDLKKNITKKVNKVVVEATTNAPTFLRASSSNGSVDGIVEAKDLRLNLELPMTPHGYTLGYGHRSHGRKKK